MRDTVFGKEHPETLRAMNDLAAVLTNQNKYEEAVQTHGQALRLREKVSGKEHPDTLLCIKKLADVLRRQGKYEEAERILERGDGGKGSGSGERRDEGDGNERYEPLV